MLKESRQTVVHHVKNGQKMHLLNPTVSSADKIKFLTAVRNIGDAV